MSSRDQLIALIRDKALRFGDFTLASGKKAKFYLDCREVTLDSAGAKLIGESMLDLISDNLPEAIGGMSLGADPIVGAIITTAGLRGLPLKGFLVRKEAKSHGTGKFVEGPVASGQRVVIVEDVVTTGGSSLLAIERAEAIGLKVEKVLAIIDRLEGGREAFAAKGYELQSLLTVRDFGIEPAA